MGTHLSGLVVAVDGGGSTTHAVALTLDGEVVGRGHGPGSSPQWIGVEASIDIVDAAVRQAIGPAEVVQSNVYLSGLDLDAEVDAYATALVRVDWTGPGTVVANDLWALLRAGTESADAVAVICGTGINAVGVRADGATARFSALGPISGDWGGGSGLGEEALWHAARAEDRRGPETLLRDVVLEGMGVGSVAELTEQLHVGTRSPTELAVLSPGVFDAARRGDAVAGSIVNRQADEVVAFARASLIRLEMLDHEVPVVLGGGIIRARDERMMTRITERLAADAPKAHIVLVTAPPIVGAALLALESARASRDALERARAELTA